MTAHEYIGIEAEEESFKKAFEEIESAGVTSPSTPCFDGSSIAQTDEGLAVEQLDDALCLGSR